MDPIVIEETEASAIDLYIAEGRRLIERAEACERSLREGGALEGHRLMAAQLLTAMRRLEETMLRHRDERRHRPPAVPAIVLAPSPPGLRLFRGRRKPEIRTS